jgi:hypothetical protein
MDVLCDPDSGSWRFAALHHSPADITLMQRSLSCPGRFVREMAPEAFIQLSKKPIFAYAVQQAGPTGRFQA